MQVYQTVTLEYGFFESFPAGIKMGVQTLKDYVNQFQYVFTKEGASSLGGFGAIGSLFPPTWNWHAFWIDDRFSFGNSCLYEYTPYPRIGWRTCVVSPLRSCHTSQAEREVYGICTDSRYGFIVGACDLCQRNGYNKSNF